MANSLSAGAPPQTPLGEITVPPDPCLYLRGLLLRVWRETGEGKKRKGRGVQDLAHPQIFVWRPLWRERLGTAFPKLF